MFDILYQGIKIFPSYSAMRDLMNEGETLEFVKEILEFGYETGGKRKKGKIEKWLDKGKKTYNAVVVKDYNEILKEEVWLLIHFGKFKKKN